MSGLSETDRVKAFQDLRSGGYLKKPFLMENLALLLFQVGFLKEDPGMTCAESSFFSPFMLANLGNQQEKGTIAYTLMRRFINILQPLRYFSFF